MDLGQRRLFVHGSMNVLAKCPVSPNVQRLQSIANAEDGLLQIKSILQKKLVHSLAVGVRGCAFRLGLLPVLLWIQIGRTAREQDPTATTDRVCDSRLA